MPTSRRALAQVVTEYLRAALAATRGPASGDAALGLRQHCEQEAAKALPTACPYTMDQIVSHDWYPGNRHGVVDDLEDEAQGGRS